MKYCLPYDETTSKSDFINEADEWNIKYNPADKTLIKFLEVHKDKRINLITTDDLDLTESDDLEYLEFLCNRYSNLYIGINKCNDEIIKEIKKYKFKYYFSNLYIDDWDLLYMCIEANVTDVIIMGSMGFELDKVAKIAHEHNIQVRVFPNVAQSTVFTTSALLKFFIRPEDISWYEDYVDVCEFFGEINQMAYYRIYKENQQWSGKLNELILEFNSDLDSRFISPKFAEIRRSCNKNCMKGGLCRTCYRIEELSHTLEDAGLAIQIDKK